MGKSEGLGCVRAGLRRQALLIFEVADHVLPEEELLLIANHKLG